MTQVINPNLSLYEENGRLYLDVPSKSLGLITYKVDAVLYENLRRLGIIIPAADVGTPQPLPSLPQLDLSNAERLPCGGVLFRDVLPKHTLASMYECYQRLDEAGFVRKTGSQVPGRKNLTNHHCFEVLYEGIINRLQELGIGSFTVSYNHWVQYEAGCHLVPHKDDRYGNSRARDLTASLAIRHTGAESSSWPLHVDRYEYRLNEGDLVVFNGKDLIHWRDPLPVGQASNCLLFFFKGKKE